MSTSKDFIETLAIDLEAPRDIKNGNMGNVYSGYYKAPSTGRHRFYISCDDMAVIYFSNVNMDPS